VGEGVRGVATPAFSTGEVVDLNHDTLAQAVKARPFVGAVLDLDAITDN
jgi:hypothetical protein